MLQVEAVGPLSVFDTGIRPNASALYPEFVEEISDELTRVATHQSTISLGELSAHVGNNAEVWRGVIGRHGDREGIDNGRLLCCNNTLCIMNTSF